VIGLSICEHLKIMAAGGDGSGRLRKGHYGALAGEFLVLAELALRGLDATPTLSRTKSIDILVHNPRTRRPFKVEVKTSSKRPEREHPFGHNYAWLIGRGAEELRDRDLIYAFVLVELALDRKPPTFYLVPARFVAEYVRWSHRRHLQVVRRQRNPDSPMRKFRIPVATPDPQAVPRSWKPMPWRRWHEDWSVFGPTTK
jgi:hypothetical protein